MKYHPIEMIPDIDRQPAPFYRLYRDVWKNEAGKKELLSIYVKKSLENGLPRRFSPRECMWFSRLYQYVTEQEQRSTPPWTLTELTRFLFPADAKERITTSDRKTVLRLMKWGKYATFLVMIHPMTRRSAKPDKIWGNLFSHVSERQYRGPDGWVTRYRIRFNAPEDREDSLVDWIYRSVKQGFGVLAVPYPARKEPDRKWMTAMFMKRSLGNYCSVDRAARILSPNRWSASENTALSPTQRSQAKKHARADAYENLDRAEGSWDLLTDLQQPARGRQIHHTGQERFTWHPTDTYVHEWGPRKDLYYTEELDWQNYLQPDGHLDREAYGRAVDAQQTPLVNVADHVKRQRQVQIGRKLHGKPRTSGWIPQIKRAVSTPVHRDS